MKNIYPFLFFLLGILFLTGCQQLPLEKEQVLTEEKKQTNTNTQTTFDCSIPHYYENIKLEKQVSFTWDKDQEAYVAEVPELCIKFISRPYDTTISNEKWKELLRESAEAGFFIKNNSFETRKWGNRRINHFLIRNKIASASLDDAIQNDYFIRSNHLHEHEGNKYCYIIQDERVDTEVAGNRIQHISETNPLTSYRLVTLNDVLTQEEKQEEYYVSSQFCGDNYPFWRDNFDVAHNNQLLYSKNHPERYVLYRVDDNQDRSFSLFANLEVQFTD